MSFLQLNLDPDILKAIKTCGYTQPTPIQEKSIPVVLRHSDLVACAQTGTGKTAAFVWPALHLLNAKEPDAKEPDAKKPAKHHPRVLILTPTRELAAQITQSSRQYGKFLRFRIVTLVGGMPYPRQIQDLQQGADVIVATPGRLMDHIQQNRVNLSGIKMLVLDEADRMLDMGFIDDVSYIAKLTPSKRQTLLFSATMDKQLGQIVKQILKDPVHINLSNEALAAPKIEQKAYVTRNRHHKLELLQQILTEEQIYKAIIFSATKVNADELADELCDQGFAAAALHGDLRQSVRTRTIEKLKNGRIQYLVATDVAARGIDINDITHVINYDLPKFSEDYVHRIGRTGRAGKSGVAISFVSPTDAKHLQSIERYLGSRIELIGKLEAQRPSRPKQKGKPGAKTNARKGARSGGWKAKSSSSRSSKSSDSNWSDKPAKRRSGKSDSNWSDKPAKSRSSKSDSNWSDKPAKSRSSKSDSNWSDKPAKSRSSKSDSNWSDKPAKRRSSKPDSNWSDKPAKRRGGKSDSSWGDKSGKGRSAKSDSSWGDKSGKSRKSGKPSAAKKVWSTAKPKRQQFKKAHTA